MSPSTSGDAARSVPVGLLHEPEPVPVPAEPELDELQGHGREQAFLPGSAPARMSISQPFIDGVAPLVAGNEAKTSGVLSSPTAPVPSIEKQVAPDENDKCSWRPASVTAAAVPVRPKGPSLLTQRLAEARGILPLATSQSLDTSHSGPRPQHSSCDPAIGSVPKQAPRTDATSTPLQTANGDPENRDDSDDSTLTPRASPRLVPMASTAAISTISLSQRVPDTILSRTVGPSEVGDEEQRPRSYRDFMGLKGRAFSSERTDKDRKPKDLLPINRTYSNTLASPHDATTMISRQDGHSAHQGLERASAAVDERSPARPRNADHRLSMGPEKVWSIGSDDLNNDQDGQVEKSIAEVLAGVEPNARSRKASHSLRFFKEGLPEEKLKRRDSRLAPREKFLAMDDAELDRYRGSLHGGDQVRSLQPSPGQTEEIPGRFTRTRTFPLQSTDTQHHDEEALDYFQVHATEKGHAAPQTPLEGQTIVTEKASVVNYPTIEEGEELQEGGIEVAVEDADLSGEEKISSAVFVPHKGPQDVPERPVESEVVFDIPGKPHQRNENGASWLVKADEPEADELGAPEVTAERIAHDASHHRLGPGQHAIAAEQSNQPAPTPLSTTDYDFASHCMVKPPPLVSPGYEELVHDHQSAPEQPLDAIELIPYRHQVGGHTTLWRFSKRAVCKQLNNRENEFYEKIERYHRDLLPFLPRYVCYVAGSSLTLKERNLVNTNTGIIVDTLVSSM